MPATIASTATATGGLPAEDDVGPHDADRLVDDVDRQRDGRHPREPPRQRTRGGALAASAHRAEHGGDQQAARDALPEPPRHRLRRVPGQQRVAEAVVQERARGGEHEERRHQPGVAGQPAHRRRGAGRIAAQRPQQRHEQHAEHEQVGEEPQVRGLERPVAAPLHGDRELGDRHDAEEVTQRVPVGARGPVLQPLGVDLRRHEHGHADDERHPEPEHALADDGARGAAPERVPQPEAREDEEQRHPDQHAEEHHRHERLELRPLDVEVERVEHAQPVEHHDPGYEPGAKRVDVGEAPRHARACTARAGACRCGCPP